MKPKVALLAVFAAILSHSCGVPMQQTELVAGKKCVAKIIRDGSGPIIDVDTDPPCVKGSGNLFVVGSQSRREPLLENTGPHGITFGNGTTTCYGPPIPNPPRCVCT